MKISYISPILTRRQYFRKRGCFLLVPVAQEASSHEGPVEEKMAKNMACHTRIIPIPRINDVTDVVDR